MGACPHAELAWEQFYDDRRGDGRAQRFARLSSALSSTHCELLIGRTPRVPSKPQEIGGTGRAQETLTRSQSLASESHQLRELID